MTNSNLRIIYLCNAVDQETKNERDVRFDSPAATNKVFGIAKALQTQNAEIHILSLGRGKQNGSGKCFPSFQRSVQGVPVHYAAFWHIPLLTHFIGALSLASQFKKIVARFKGQVVVIAYNRLWHYLPSLISANLHHADIYLDLEDGATSSPNFISRCKNKFSQSLFSLLCKKGAILAGKSLASQVNTPHSMVCFGSTDLKDENQSRWAEQPVNILFGGSLLMETGVQLLLDAITILNEDHPEHKGKILITITGQGIMEKEIKRFSQSSGKEWMQFLGNVDRITYQKILDRSHIGLCLKISTSEMGRTTFPSKVIEYASNRLAIITTRVSDVPDLLDETGAVFVDPETPEFLAQILTKTAAGEYSLQEISRNGSAQIDQVCNPTNAGKQLMTFFGHQC